VSWLLGAAAPAGLASRWSVLALTIAAAVFGLALVYFGAMRRVGLPLGDLVGAADRVASGDFSTRVVERGPPSLKSVTRAFNDMTARLESQEQQRRQLMADIAHELRTPLTIIQGRLEGLLDGVYERDDAALGRLLNDTRILGRLVEDLRVLANAESGNLALHMEPTDLVELVHDVVNGLAAEASGTSNTVRVEAALNLPLVDIDPLRIREVLSNLLSNALRHGRPGGAVSIAVDTEEDRIRVRVKDAGSGMAQAELSKIFDRFYKGTASNGSGLGLTIARRLVLAHGGEIWATSELGRGTEVTVTLPVHSRR